MFLNAKKHLDKGHHLYQEFFGERDIRLDPVSRGIAKVTLPLITIVPFIRLLPYTLMSERLLMCDISGDGRVFHDVQAHALLLRFKYSFRFQELSVLLADRESQKPMLK